MQDLVIANGVVVTLGETNRLIPSGAVAVVDGKIAEVDSIAQLAGRYAGSRFIDARGGLIMPGFINTHMHFYSSMARGMPLDGFAPKEFQDILEGLWWRLDKALTADDIHYSALVALIECIRQGTTSIVDHHASPRRVDGSLDLIADAVLASGLRACLCYEVSDRDGKAIAKQGIAENERFIKRCRDDLADNRRLAAAFGLHASFTVDDDTLDAVAASTPAPIHIHMAEGKVDVEASQKKYRSRPLARLDRRGLLNRTALLAHCIHMNEDEHARMAQAPVWALHNPQSNMNNAVGTAPVSQMLKKNVRVALGTDSVTSNMLEEMRVFGLIHKAASGDPCQLGFGDIYQVLFRNNAALASELFGLRTGTLEVGAAADIVTLDYIPPTPLTEESFLGHLFFGLPNATVRNTIAAGEVLMQDQELIHMDADEIAAKARELAPRLWQRME